MSEHRVASRYAKSLLELAVEQKSLDTVYTDISDFLATAHNSIELVNLLKSPIVKGDKKRAILTSLFKSANKVTVAFFDIIVRKGRENLLVEIAEEFKAQYNTLNGIASATVTSAVALSKKSLTEVEAFIKKQLNSNKVEIKTVVNPDIIGGLVIRFEDKLIDASIDHQLKEIKKALVLN